MSVLCLLVVFLFCLCTFPSSSIAASAAYSHLQCSLCVSALDEIEYAVEQTKEEYDVLTKWRVDDKRKIPYKRTEFRILEILEKEVHPQLEKYGLCAVVEDKTGKTVKRYCREDWRFGNYSKLSKGLERHVKERYDELVEEEMEEMTLLFHRATAIAEIKQKVCVDKTKMCRRLPEYAKTSTAAPNPNAPPPFEEPKQEDGKDNQTAAAPATDTQTAVPPSTANDAASNTETKKDDL